jgi:hypothetical protein
LQPNDISGLPENYVKNVRKHTYEYLIKTEEGEEFKCFTLSSCENEIPRGGSVRVPQNYKQKLEIFVKSNKALNGYSWNNKLPNISTVASFDDMAEVITEFYYEWKHKSKVKSNVLKSLVLKLRKTQEETKDDNYLVSQESTASDSLINHRESKEKLSVTFKRKPKRRQNGIKGDLKDIL